MTQPKPNQHYRLSSQKAIQDYKDGIISATGLVYYTKLLAQKVNSLSLPAYLGAVYARCFALVGSDRTTGR